MKKIIDRIITCFLTFVLVCGFFTFLSFDEGNSLKAKAVSIGTGYALELKDGGIYYIKNQRSGLYLDIENSSTSSGAQLIQYDYKGYPNQQYKLTKYSDSSGAYYTITPMNCAYFSTSKVLQVAGNSSNNEAEIQLGNLGVYTNQKFRIIPTENNDNSFVIKTGSSSYSKCVTVYTASFTSGTKIIQYSYFNGGNNDNDHWYFEEVPVFNGTYYVKNQKSGLYLDVDDNKTVDGTKLIQYDYHGSTNQQFRISPVANSCYYTITPVLCTVDGANTRVEVKDGSTANETAIQLGNNSNTLKQYFYIFSTGNSDGAFKILSALDSLNQKAFAVKGASLNKETEIILYSYSNNGSSDNDHWYFEDITPLNQRTRVNLTAEKQTVIDMTCPDDKLYTIETFPVGSTISDPIISMTSSLITVQDDNSGEGNQAKISFRGQKGANIRVSIWTNNTVGRSCFIQIRKQKAALFGGKYSDINTNPDLNTPNNVLRPLYDSYRYLDASRDQFLSFDERNMPAYNSEVMFFTGHGNTNSATFVVGRIGGGNLGDMRNVKVAVWSSCYSSVLDSVGNSLVTRSIALGARSALGFNQDVLASDAKKFTDKFFTELANGKTVDKAAESAKSLFIVPAWMAKIKDYVILGDRNTLLTTPTGEQASALSVQSSDNNFSFYDFSLLTHFLSACDYQTEMYSDNRIRYYKTINGFWSNQYIDVENDRIVSTNYSVENDEKPILPIRICSEMISTENENIGRLNALRNDSSVAVDTQIMYIFDGDKFIPVELNCITYLNEARYQDMICIDLNTGEEIPYESFAYSEGNQ